MAPWTQYFDLQGMEPPKSIVKNLNFVGIKGTYASLRHPQAQPRPRPDISNVTLERFRRDHQE